MTLAHSPLGKASAYPSQYDASLLHPIARGEGRAALDLAPDAPLPFGGWDVWNAWELGWLDPRGKPRVALAEIRVPADSPRLVESKSLKLYLNGFAQARLAGSDELRATLVRDLSAATGAATSVVLTALGRNGHAIEALEGDCIDDLPVDISCYGPPDASLLRAEEQSPASEVLVSHLLRSNCPVTGQPDWGSVQLRYSGPRLDRAALLRYLASYREHCGFHEQCIEQIFLDVLRRCAPTRLSVYGRYTRRGGIDINPFRSSVPGESPGNPRTVRQ
jgi:7-cyano-7-deazaguanine reductase